MRGVTRSLAGVVVGALLVVLAWDGGAYGADDRTFRSERFSVTWEPRTLPRSAAADADGNGTPDGIEALAALLEGARSFLEADLGYLPPPVEGRYRVYLAQGGTRTVHAPGGEGGRQSSFIVFNPGLLGDDVAPEDRAALVIHEYFHAIQIGYDGDEARWIKEASSTWVEDLWLDPADPNHGALLGFLPFPRVALTESEGSHEYGAFVFLQFLVERLDDPAVVKELWEAMAVPEAVPGAPNLDAVGAIRTILERRGMSLPDAWTEFMVWQRRLHLFEEGDAYRRVVIGSPWPTRLRVTEVTDESCRLSTRRDPRDLLQPLSGDYAVLRPGPDAPSSATAIVSVEGPPGSTAAVILRDVDGRTSHQTLAFTPEGIASTEIPFGRTQARRAVVALGNGEPRVGSLYLDYSLLFPGASATTVGVPQDGVVSAGTATVVGGEVSCNGAPQDGARVRITETEIVSGESRSFETRARNGRYSLLVTPEANSRYTVEVVDPLLGYDRGGPWTVEVALAVTLDLERDRIAEGEALTMAGRVFPAHAGASVALEYRRPDGAWTGALTVQTDPDGSYSGEIVLPRDGIWQVRARVLDTGDLDHVPGISGERFVEVGAG